jgi:aquaporin Z
LKASQVAPYFVAQILGAVAAAMTVAVLRPWPAVDVPAPAALPMAEVVLRPFLAEVIFTFALVFVILNVATSKRAQGNQYFGFAIASTVVAGAYAVGPISGGAFNPAVVVGLMVMGLKAWSSLWVYLLANTVGAVGAALVFRALNPDDR